MQKLSSDDQKKVGITTYIYIQILYIAFLCSSKPQVTTFSFLNVAVVIELLRQFPEIAIFSRIPWAFEEL